MDAERVKDTVKARYGQAATRAREGGDSSCCGGGTASGGCADPITSNLYDAGQEGEVPALARRARAVVIVVAAELDGARAGEAVHDQLRRGIDVLLSARRVGPPGWAFGLDMTDEMLALAEENKRKSGLRTNVTFLKGEIEHIPLPDHSVDVIISNCVINLSGDKDRVLREAFRVLKPGGRFAVSDVVVHGQVPAAIRKSMELWIGCVAGALADEEYATKLEAAGFEGIEIEDTRVQRGRCAGIFSGEGLMSRRWRLKSTAPVRGDCAS
jgi:SAM-dependent methyltransferase